MKLERRAVVVLGVVALVAVPAVVLRVLCVGRSCDPKQGAARKVPFCALPPNTRDAIAAGYREGRSPDILAVTAENVRVVSRSSDPRGTSWPSIDQPPGRARLVFWGRRVAEGADLGAAGLDDVAPTLARIGGVRIPHPEVRSGRAVAGATEGPIPRLLVTVVLHGVRDVASDPVLDALAAAGTAGPAEIGSLPRDPAALMTTIGTGGEPAQHGITGSLLRNDRARVASAWDPRLRQRGVEPFGPAPPTVIAALGDDLDEILDQRPLIGVVADHPAARGLIGGNWYVTNDRDSHEIVATDRVLSTLERTLRQQDFGRDAVVDLLAVSLRSRGTEGATPALHVLRTVERVVGARFAAAIVVLPKEPRSPLTFSAQDVARSVGETVGHPVVEADTAGGFFLDQRALAAGNVTKDDVVEAMSGEVIESYGSKTDMVFADVFPGLAVSFARFC